jgi:hypothetical protein
VNEGKGQLTETQYDHPDLIPDEMGSAAQKGEAEMGMGSQGRADVPQLCLCTGEVESILHIKWPEPP